MASRLVTGSLMTELAFQLVSPVSAAASRTEEAQSASSELDSAYDRWHASSASFDEFDGVFKLHVRHLLSLPSILGPPAAKVQQVLAPKHQVGGHRPRPVSMRT